jgi:GNAT superfamily N-acetyltransferase
LLAAGDDIAAAGRLVQQAYFALPGYPHDDEYDLVIGDVGARLDDAQVVVAFDDGQLVGCLTYVPDADSPHAEFEDEHAASFRYFGVDPAMQGRGIGEAMVQWCIAAARRDGRHRLRIHTLESMPAAQRLYLRMGFVRDPDHDEVWDGIVGLAFAFHC